MSTKSKGGTGGFKTYETFQSLRTLLPGVVADCQAINYLNLYETFRITVYMYNYVDTFT